MIKRRGLAICTALLLAFGSENALADSWRLSSLEWPPYAGASLPEQGTMVRLVRLAFSAMGHSLEVSFFPWRRAMQTGLGPGFVGFFPGYWSQERAEGPCAFSDPAGSSPLGFAEAISAPVVWTTLDDLTGKTIGTVAGYVNAAGVRERADQGLLTLEPAPDDLTNLRKVAAGRLPLAEIDVNVFALWLKNTPDLQGHLQINPRLLESKPLYICFQKNEAGERARALFNAGLKKIEAQAFKAEPYAPTLGR